MQLLIGGARFETDNGSLECSMNVECAIQAQIVEGLRLLGYTVLVTSARSYRPSSNGKKGYGADRGVPDLIVMRRSWPKGAALLLEVKRPHAWKYSSIEQRELCESGRILVVTDFDEARLCCSRADALYR